MFLALAVVSGLLLIFSTAHGDNRQDDLFIMKLDQDMVRTKSGLKYIDLRIGTRKQTKVGDTLVVHYTGWLRGGKKFDSSLDRKEPFVFKLGTGQVIKGWDEGLAGMRVGGKRKLIIPPDLAYGKKGAGNVIPADAELTFEVELLEVK
jgi:FKBP-type peptidyl-prolyl cis-trans isomerase FkpA